VKSGNPDVREFKLVTASNVGKAEGFEGKSFSLGKVQGSMDEAEVSILLEQAKSTGRIEGQRESERKMLTTVNQGLQSLEGVLDEISRFRRELFKEAEEEVIEFVRLLAKKVISKELSLAPELLKAMVEQSFNAIEKEKKINVLVNPSDLAIFSTAKEDFLKKLEGVSEMRIASDSRIQQGTAFIKTEALQVEVSVESMIDQMMREVVQAKHLGEDVNKEGDPK
jgi:flagellar assembly protein FliH